MWAGFVTMAPPITASLRVSAEVVLPLLPFSLTAAATVKMDRDYTVRRIRAQQNQNQQQIQPDFRDEAAALNGLRRRKLKPEVSAGLLGESSAALLLLGFVILLWLLVLLSLQQLIISSPGHFNALRARYAFPGIPYCAVYYGIT